MKNFFKNKDFGLIVIQSFCVLLLTMLLAFMLWVAIDAFFAWGFWGALFLTSPAWGILLMAYCTTGGRYNA
jgi:hypothetical protein